MKKSNWFLIETNGIQLFFDLVEKLLTNILRKRLILVGDINCVLFV